MTAAHDIQIGAATFDEKPILRQLLELYELRIGEAARRLRTERE